MNSWIGWKSAIVMIASLSPKRRSTLKKVPEV